MTKPFSLIPVISFLFFATYSVAMDDKHTLANRKALPGESLPSSQGHHGIGVQSRSLPPIPLKPAQKEDSELTFQLGLVYLKQENWVEAAKQLCAAGDHIGAKVEYAKLLENGCPGIPQDFNEAIRLFEDAMGYQFTEAYFSLYAHTLKDEIQDKWTQYRREAAREAAKLLWQNVRGGGTFDTEKGMNLYLKLCAVADLEALCFVGFQYTINRYKKEKEETTRGFNFLKKAAAGNHLEALYTLGCIYENGLYHGDFQQKPNREEAKRSYQIAGGLGHVESQNALKRF